MLGHVPFRLPSRRRRGPRLPRGRRPPQFESIRLFAFRSLFVQLLAHIQNLILVGILVIVLVLMMQRYLVQGLTLGAVKG